MNSKSKNLKKVMVVIISIVVSVVLLLLAIRFTPLATLIFSDDEYEYGDSYDEAIDTINNKLPTDVFFIGEEMTIREGVNYKTISHIDEKTLSSEKKFSVLIISDLNGSVKISDDEYTFLKERIKDYNFYLYYCGTDKIEKFIDNEIFEEGIYMKGDLCSAFVTFEGERTGYGGIYTENLKKIDDKVGREEGLSESLFTNLLRCYKSNN